jgi:RimJ/RimL family protein N-acetyltransferase
MTMTVPTLETERLILRAFKVADHAPFAEMSADAELMRFVGGQMDAPDAWRRMAAYTGMWVLRGYGPWALQHKETGAFVGYSGVTWPNGFPEPEINWGLHRAHLGQGFAAEAAAAARAFAYDQLGFSTIMSFIDHENAPSIAVAKRLGARLDGGGSYKGRAMGIWRHVPPASQSQTGTPMPQ